MATDVSICNDALLMLGAVPISDFNESGDRARLCANLFPANRDAVLRSHTWNCCVKRVSLSPLVDSPAYGWAYTYQLPGDWIRTIKLGNASDYASDFRHEGRLILSDSSAMSLRYVYKNTNAGTWDALLVDVMVKRMAWVLAYPVTKSTSLRESMMMDYERALKTAKSIDSMEEPSEQVAEESPLISIRG